MSHKNQEKQAKNRSFHIQEGKKATIPLHALPRIFIENDLDTGSIITVESNQAHYLMHVLRLQIGDSIRLFNGRHGDWLGRITSLSKRTLDITMVEQLVSQSPLPDIRLYCAPIKKAYFDFMVMKATELGVTEIYPLLTQRTQVRETNTQRLTEIAREAAEQSDRLSVPIIHETQDLSWLISTITSPTTLLYGDEHGESEPIHTVLLRLKNSAMETNMKPSFGILIGPEGGFTKEEMALLKQRPHSFGISLGPRILRADTAAIAALSCLQAVCGDWQTPPHAR